MPDPFDRVFHRVFLGDIVTGSQVLRDGWVAVRGEVIMRARVAAAVLRSQIICDGTAVLAQPGTGPSLEQGPAWHRAQPGTGRFIRRITQ